MRLIATVHAYDVMSLQHVTVIVREYPDDPSWSPSIVFECTTEVPGIGETDPRLWLQDALVGLLEAI